MSYQFTIIKSTNVGAPTLNGQSGSLVAVLDFCLTGSVTGWTRTFTSSSSGTVTRAQYQMPSGSRMSINIQDDAIGTGGAKEARIFAFESGSAIDAGSGQFPLAGQGVAGTGGYLIARKSTSADTTARVWQCFADSSTFYFFAQTGDQASTYEAFMFGDIYSLKSNDLYRCIIIGRASENTTATETTDTLAAINTAVAGHYMSRTYGGGGVSTAVGKHGDAVKGSTTALNGTVQYPNGPDGTMYISPVWVHENASSTVRGRLRGSYQICHAIANFSDGDTFNGSSTLVGKTFQILKSSCNLGVYCIETSATLETN
jgi:hypothetical protein